MARALRENATTFFMAAISSTLFVLLARVVTAMLSLETKMIATLFIWWFLQLLQLVLVAERRRSRHWFVQYGAMAAYYLPTSLVFYAANAVYSTSHINEYTPEIVVNLLMMLGFDVFFIRLKLTTMAAYSLRDGGERYYTWRFLLWIFYLACLQWELGRIWSANLGLPAKLSLQHPALPQLTLSAAVAVFIVFVGPPESFKDYEIKSVADYMKRESNSSSSSPFFDGSLQLDSCRYPFRQRKDGQWISIKDYANTAMQEEGLNPYVSLSYSLCWLLSRRYFGFHCAEQGDEKVRRFALAGLGLGTDGYKRAFTIVEVQLAFLHDYLFTTSLPDRPSGRIELRQGKTITKPAKALTMASTLH